MRALIVSHDAFSPPDGLRDLLEARGLEVDTHVVVPQERHDRPDVDGGFPEFAAYDVVVLMGAPWSVYDAEGVGSWVQPEIEQLQRLDSDATAVLGICFGGQLLAAAHGGSVVPTEQPEIGWVRDISSRREDLVPAGDWFAWHLDRWSLPPEATEVASNDKASQAFVLGRHLAVQFHPELTADMLRGWLDHGGREMLPERGIDERDLVAETEEAAGRSRARLERLVAGFLDHAGVTAPARRGS